MTPEAVRDNVRRVLDRIAEAACRVGRDPGRVRLVAVAKRKPAFLVEAALRAGVRDIGENYVQEGEAKRRQVQLPGTWHLIGPLQRNKVGRAVRVFDVIQTVERVDVARAIAERLPAEAAPLPVLIQVNVAGDPAKAGVDPKNLAALVAELRAIERLDVRGLMTIPPLGSAEDARPHFAALRQLAERLGLRELSMGMSADLEVAVEEGATIVRVGRAIFGERG